MNQQRQRRFRKVVDSKKIQDRLVQEGKPVPETNFDSNCITPGTPFMARLSECIRFYIQKKILEDPEWRDVKVIFSGHEVPGEGEHKIIEYMRKSKSRHDYDPNQTHCLYGMDADLIMLSLSTHEPNMVLFRENQLDLNFKKIEDIQFHYLHISLLREYLEYEFKVIDFSKGSNKVTFDLENIVDDFVAMCLCIGNDFIPSLSVFDIVDGHLDILMRKYKEALPHMDGYLNEAGHLNVKNFEILVSSIAYLEEQAMQTSLSTAIAAEVLDKSSPSTQTQDNPDIAMVLYQKRQQDESDEEEFVGIYDDSDGDVDEDWRNTFYMEKMQLDVDDPTQIKTLTHHYVSALQWTLSYYYFGCPSWSWYYPYHYSPLMVDMVGLDQYKIEFELSAPFAPYQQLIGVLPPESKDCLPKPYQRLLLDRVNSPLKDYIPEVIEFDKKGHNEWENIVLLPFLPEAVIVKASEMISNSELTKDEIQRNQFGFSLVYHFDPNNRSQRISPNLKLFPNIEQCYSSCGRLEDIEIPSESKIFKLLKGTSLGPDTVGCIPSLKSLVLKSQLKKHGVKMFRFESNKESLVMTLESNGTGLPEIGATVFTWPYFQEAIANGIIVNGEWIAGEHSEPVDKKQFSTILADLNNRGLNVKNVTTWVCVNYVEGLTRDEKMSSVRRWSSTLSFIPLEFVLYKHPLGGDPRYKTLKTLSMEQSFQVGSNSICVHYKFMGKLCRIEGIEGKKAKVCLLDEPRHVDSMIYKLSREPDTLQWYPIQALSKILELKTDTIGRIASSLLVSGVGERSLDIGLKLRYNKKETVLLDYVTKDKNTWLFSEKTLTLFQSYKDTFPEIFSFLETKPYTQGDRYTYKDIYMHHFKLEDLEEPTTLLNCRTRFQMLKTFLYKLPTSSMKLVPLGSCRYTPDRIKAIEEIADHALKGSKDSTENGLPPRLFEFERRYLLKPLSHFEVGVSDKRDAYREVEFMLGDRVVYMLNSGTIPFGKRGTVVSILRNQVEIVLDYPIIGGTDLAGRCSQMRGIVTDMESVFNLSYHRHRYK